MKTFLKILAGVLLAGGLFTFAFYRTPQERAFTQHLKAAQNGDTTAAFAVAQAYQSGEGTKPNLPQAAAWFEKSAAAGNAQAAWELYQLYHSGQVPAPDPEAPAVYLQMAAQNGQADAQYEWGTWYENGNGVTQHNGQALFWYQTAVQNGSAAAQAKVDTFAQEQPELSAQLTAFMQTLQAAQQPSNFQAMFDVGQAYRTGNPVLHNDEIALGWFKQAWEESDHTFAPAAFELFKQYNSGEGVTKNEEIAGQLLAQAAELKDPAAQYQLGEFAYMDSTPQYADAFAWFSNAATQGYAPAQYMTGFMLLQGQGTAKSVPLAVRFFTQAADQNYADAQFVLGQLYLKGLGVKKSRKRGRAWLEKATQNGNQEAANLLKKA